MKVTYSVTSIEETWNVAREFAKWLKPGDVVCLHGELGSGKTTFTQGLAAAVGVRGRVVSPTFCIVQEHKGDAFLVHMDLYRLKDESDVEAIGWDDYLLRGAILVVEWPDRAGGLIPPSAKKVYIVAKEKENRIITIDKGGEDLI